jgi:YD repeat-containing protein
MCVGPHAEKTTNAYDAMGNLTYSSNTQSQVWYSYDLDSRLRTTSNHLGRVETRAYDLDGNVTSQSVTDNGTLLETTESQYDSDGRLTLQRVTRVSVRWATSFPAGPVCDRPGA